MGVIRKTAIKVLPAGSKRRIFAGRVKSVVLHGPRSNVLVYRNWIRRIEPKTLNPILKAQHNKISVIVPCYNTPPRYIKALVGSLMNQTYRNWELCLADGSTDELAAKNIENHSSRDSRIKYVRVKKNLGISGNTNEGLKHTTGSYIAFLDHDDILPVWSLNEVATAIKQRPKAEVFYSDEDRLSDNGRVRLSPFFKPDWSPDLFLSANYVAHFFVAKRSLVSKLKNLRADFDGSQDYDFMLRALDHNPQIVHIPKILYHMRMAHGSTAKLITVKDYAHTAGARALADYLKRHQINAEVKQIPDRPTNHRIKYKLKGEPLVSIIIPFKDKADLLRECVKSIKNRTSYKNYEIILISNNSKEKATADYLESLKADKAIRIYYYDQPFNYSAINNFGRKQAKGRVLVFLNNDTEIINPEWLEELVSVSIRPEVGATGPLLLYPDGSIQHAGVIVGHMGTAGHVFRDLKPGTLTPFWLPDWPRNYLAVTGACLAVEAKKFDKVKGFNEEFIMAGSDVVLGLDLFEAGYQNVYWPYARLIHHESKSIESYQNAPISDYHLSLEHYKPYLNYKDPYFNPNLSLESEIPTLRTKYE